MSRSFLAYIGLGSNLGNSLENLANARAYLSRIGKNSKASPIYKSPSQGVENLPDFYNQVLSIETNLPPLDLLKYLKGVEVKLGRQHRRRWHSREVDLDLVLYDEGVLKDRYFEFPHPEMLNRQFVLRPLVDLNEELVHPMTRRKLSQHLFELEQSQGETLEKVEEK